MKVSKLGNPLVPGCSSEAKKWLSWWVRCPMHLGMVNTVSAGWWPLPLCSLFILSSISPFPFFPQLHVNQEPCYKPDILLLCALELGFAVQTLHHTALFFSRSVAFAEVVEINPFVLFSRLNCLDFESMRCRRYKVACLTLIAISDLYEKLLTWTL